VFSPPSREAPVIREGYGTVSQGTPELAIVVPLLQKLYEYITKTYGASEKHEKIYISDKTVEKQ
jgi:hypothetical protein